MVTKDIHSGHRSRLKEITAKTGLENMPEHQVLEFLLTFVIPRKDTNPIAHNLIKSFGSLSGVLEASSNDLVKVDGIGKKTADFLSCLPEIFSCYRISKGKEKPRITTTYEAFLYIKPFLQYKSVEELYVLCIDNRNKLMYLESLSKGICNAASVDMQKLMAILLKSKCANFILAHNHPSNILSPSLSDDKFTRAVAVSSKINGFNFLDHIITCGDDYFSYARNGSLDKYKSEACDIVDEKQPSHNSAIVGEKLCEFNVKEDMEA